MKKIFFPLLFAIYNALSLAADEPAIPSGENRFLFVVETSFSANRSAKAAKETVRELMESGVEGQIHSGDTLGLWTFNERLNTTFPMQRWSPAESKSLGESMANFLNKIRFEKKGQVKTILSSLFSVVQSSKAITVILISTGNEPIQGTPFDKEINEIYRSSAHELRDAKLPFVTVLVGRNGKLVAYAVNSSLRPIPIPNPPMSAEPVLSQVKTNAPAATNFLSIPEIIQTAPPKKIAKSNIILSGPFVTSHPQTTNATLATNVEPKTSLEKTNQVSGIKEATQTNLITSPIQAPAVATPTVQPSATLTVELPSHGVEDPKIFKSQTQSVDVAVKDLSNSSVRTAPNKLIGQSTEPLEPKTISATQNNISSQSNAAPMIATQTVSRPKKFLLIGAAIVVFACVLTFFFLRNSRNKSHPSLISRSMNQGK